MPNERNKVKAFAVGLLSTAVLLGSAGAASAGPIYGSTTNPEGEKEGRIALKTKTVRGVVKNVYSIKLTGVPVTCDDGGQLSVERTSNTIRAKIAVRRWRGRYRFSASGLESNRSNGSTYSISGWLNRSGTRLSRGRLSGEGLTGGEGVTCSMQTTFTAVKRGLDG